MPEQIDTHTTTCPKCDGALVLRFSSGDMNTITEIVQCEKCGAYYRREQMKTGREHPVDLLDGSQGG